MPVDLDALAQAVTVLVRALDNAVEASLPFYRHPLLAKVMTAKRKIGVGICGLADLLLQAGLPYDSKEGRNLARDVTAFVNYASKAASVDLAESRGPCPAVRGGQSRYADPEFLARFTALGASTVTDEEWIGQPPRPRPPLTSCPASTLRAVSSGPTSTLTRSPTRGIFLVAEQRDRLEE